MKLRRALPLALVTASSFVTQPLSTQSTRTKIRPRFGFVVQSRLEYTANPRVPQILETVYAAPDRSRWNRRLLNGVFSDRDCLFRNGESIFHLAQGQSASVEFKEEDQSSVLLSMELREAALSWPDAFGWSEPRIEKTGDDEQSEDKTVRETKVYRLSTEGAPELGSLLATLDAKGMPTSIRSFDLAGKLNETLQIRGWQTSAKLNWPQEMTLFKADQKIWDERVETIENRNVNVVPMFFVPPDRRPQARPGKKVAIRMPLDLLGLTRRRVAIPDEVRASDTPWEDAWSWAEKFLVGETKRWAAAQPPLGVSDKVRIELDEKAKPAFLWVSLNLPVLPAPKGWETLHDRPGLASTVPNFAALNTELIWNLRQDVESRDELDPPYVWLRSIGERASIAIYQSIRPNR